MTVLLCTVLEQEGNWKNQPLGWLLLKLAGHTHGGQIRVPFWGAPVTNCDLDRTRARGLFPYRRMQVNVSAGLGYSPYAPVRFSCFPEVSLLRLVPAAG